MAMFIDDREYGVNKVLWSGAWYMNGAQTASLNQAISEQPHGIVLIFSEYKDGASADGQFSSHFVPKQYVADFSGRGMAFSFYSFWNIGMKYLYISDTSIKGYGDNASSTYTIGGVTYTNTSFVLRKVIGV